MFKSNSVKSCSEPDPLTRYADPGSDVSEAVLRIHDIMVWIRLADPCLWLMGPDVDPDPAIFVIDLQETNKKLI